MNNIPTKVKMSRDLAGVAHELLRGLNAWADEVKSFLPVPLLNKERPQAAPSAM